MKILDDEYMQKVAAVYRETGTLQRTAEEMGIAYAKVRKILITIGEYMTPFSENVLIMRCKGYSVEEISKELGTTEKRVSAWLPYERGIYNSPGISREAVRSSNYRKRIGHARNRFLKDVFNDGEERQVKTMAADFGGKRPDEKTKAAQKNTGEPIRLHLKLEEKEWLSEDEKRILKKYGRSSSGSSIERDVLIPADMTLHALHYAIQRLFGWQNSHLHAFKLPQDVYERLTGNTVRGWGSLVGVLFQTVYPPDVWHERYGDDDYRSGSFKTWLRKKYTGPYEYLGHYEVFETAVKEYLDFTEWRPVIDVLEPFKFGAEYQGRVIKKARIPDLTLDELNDSISMDDGTEDLLERLRVSSVLAPEGKRTAGPEALGKKMVKRFYKGFGVLEEPEVKPVTNKLIYNYDYGDNWIVEITRLKNCDDLTGKNLLASEEFEEARNTVIEKHKPVCIHQDGMFLVDDVGGFGGFIELLETLFEPDDSDEQESMRVWAYSMGWSTRKVGNKMLL